MKWRNMILSVIITIPAVAHSSDVPEPAMTTPSAKASAEACDARPIPGTQPWTLEYRWGEGLGPGSVHLKLSSDGSATLTSTRVGGKPSVKRVTIPREALQKVQESLAKSPLACIHTQPRKGYIVFDVGQYMLKLTSRGTTVSVYADGCHEVDDPEAFSSLVDAVEGLEPFLGDTIKWGPYATSSVRSDACNGK